MGSALLDEARLYALASQITSVFETGRSRGDPSACVVLADGAGISYGIHQATDAADSLDEIVADYVAGGGDFADLLRPWLPFLAADRSRTESAPALVELLKRIGRDDPYMFEVQEGVFLRRYWQPAALQADELGLVEPLSWVSLYDLAIHSGPGRLGSLRLRFPERPPARGGNERAWTTALNRARRAWLLEHPKEVVRKTIYRVDALLGLQWGLETPFTVRGQVVR